MNRKKILIVDDELYITQILAYKLKQAGALVVTANDGEEGFKMASEHQPDLILTDFQMPGLNGLEMAVRLKEEPKTHQIPLLMLTARGHKLSPSQLARTNIKGLLPKPFSAREVIAKAAELIGAPQEDDEPPATNGDSAAA